MKKIITLLLIIVAFLVGRSTAKTNPPQIDGETINKEKTVEFVAKKSEKPNFKFFVMSFCPYGNQAETGIKPVFELLGEKIDWEPHYIIDKNTAEQIKQRCKNMIYDPKVCQGYVDQGYFPNLEACKQRFFTNESECFQKQSGNCLASENNFYCSLHGKKELNQDIREICAWNLTEDKVRWWQFVDLVNKNCQLENVDSCWQNQAKEANLEIEKIQECFSKEAVALIEKEIEIANKYKVGGSPTIIINEVNYPPENAYDNENKIKLTIEKSVFEQKEYRSPEAFKQAICVSFEKEPKECKTELSRVNDINGSGNCN